MSSSSCSPFASATTAPRKPCGGRWSEPFMISTGSSRSASPRCASIQPCSRSSRTLASSGSTAPLPYPVGRYSARTVLPSGLDHQKAVRFTALGTPRQTTASSKPNCGGSGASGRRGRTCRAGSRHASEPPKRGGALEPELQVADDRLARDEELVHEDVPGPHRDAAGRREPTQPVLRLGTDGEVVVDHRHLPVEQEVRVGRVGLESGQQVVEQLDEPAAGRSGTASTTHGPSACAGQLPLVSP